MWLRWVLLCTVFSALQGLLGAWVVPAMASEPLVEICTPSGMQWVILDSLPDSDGPANWPQGLAKPCVWAMAHMAMPSVPCSDDKTGSPPLTDGLPAAVAGLGAISMAGGAARVLLMAPMRAPPRSVA
ncbi:MAG: hypothetical protein C0445_10240 [Polaromonas sp.]|nr:hypothetical protein [Polaromonas sp.]